MSEKDHKDYWSDDGQICFVDGKGYSLTPELRSICLGDEQDILNALNGGEIKEDLTLQRQVLASIIKYRKEEGIGQSDTRTADMERAGNFGASKHKPKAVRLLTPRKRLPLRPSRTKGKSLSRK